MNKTYKTLFTILAGLCIILFIFMASNIRTNARKNEIDTITIEEVEITPEEVLGLSSEKESGIEQHNIYIYTPVEYSTKKEYPTLYLLEGLHSTDNEALDTEHKALLDKAIKNKEIQPLIVVIIPECTYRDNKLSDIIKTVNDNYNTKKKSSGRIIAGFSNGAYQIWWQVLTSPSERKLADYYIPMSPIGSSEILSGEDAFKSCAKEVTRIKIYNTCGDEGCEENYRDKYSGVEQMDLILETGSEYGFTEGKNIFKYQAAGGHDWNQAWNALVHVLPAILKE